MSEVKSALLHEYEGEHGTLIMVTEDYELFTMTSEDGHLREILGLAGTTLPNFATRRLIGESGNMRVLETKEDGARYYNSDEAIRLFNQYSKPQQGFAPADGEDGEKGFSVEAMRERLADPDDPLYDCADVARLVEILHLEERANNRLRHLLRI